MLKLNVLTPDGQSIAVQKTWYIIINVNTNPCTLRDATYIVIKEKESKPN